MNPALENRQDAIMRNISASCFAASFIVLFWCIFFVAALSRLWDFSNFSAQPARPQRTATPTVGWLCLWTTRKKKKKKKQENKSSTRNLKNLSSEAFNDCKVAPFLQAGRQRGRDGGREARRRGAHRDLQRSERSSLQGLLVC